VLLVPATERTDLAATTEAAATTAAGWCARPSADSFAAARNRLRGGLGWLHHLGAATAEGEVGDKNPLHAIRTSLEREGRQFDEIIISTLPSRMSRWLRMDLPQRAKREFRLPVTVVTASAVTTQSRP
jgi:hypothetical protein